MPGFHRFLLVDNVAENRFLLSKALLKAFPDAVVSECQDTSTAIALISGESCSVIVVHQARDLDGSTFIDLVRRYVPRAPIVLISEEPTPPGSSQGAANRVVSWDAWQSIGSVCGELIAQNEKEGNSNRPA